VTLLTQHDSLSSHLPLEAGRDLHGELWRDLRLEHELVLRCAHTRLDPAMSRQIQHLAGQEIDWLAFEQIALDQRVSPLVYKSLSGVACVPRVCLNLFRRRFEENARRNLYLAGQLLRLTDAFRAEGIVAIPYKGAVLASAVYGNLALRQFDDIDILIPQRDLPRAYHCLVGEGFQAEMPFEACVVGGGGAPGQYCFFKDGGNCLVELHTEQTLRYYPRPLDLEELFGRVVSVPLGGAAVPSFAPEDLLMILSVHASKHFWSRLLWICDVAELVQIPQGFGWDSALERARQRGCERMVLLGLYLAEEFLQVPLPEMVRARMRESRHVRTLGRRVAAMLFQDASTTPGLLERFQFRVGALEGWRAGLRYSLRLATLPTEENRHSARLGKAPSWAERLKRPFQLLRKYGTGLVRRPARPRQTKARPSGLGNN
jgi:hypothetical protein